LTTATTHPLSPTDPTLISVAEAQKRISNQMPLMGYETIHISSALGRVIAHDATAKIDHPPAPVSAMDGYALRSEDARTLPAHLRKIGVSRAGEHFPDPVLRGTCVRIFTGGVVPSQVDTIALQEDSIEQGNGVFLKAAGKPGQHIRTAGADFRKNDLCVAKGRALHTRDIALLAAAGFANVIVHKRPHCPQTPACHYYINGR
jgi:molybdopterin molybdotransferase